jgi:hypothetical protein
MAASIDRLSKQESELLGARDREQQSSDELAERLRRYEAGQHDAPPSHASRQLDGRADRDGAPFWQLVDFKSDIDETRRASIEAALESSGLLDAWVMPGRHGRRPAHQRRPYCRR